MVPIGSLTEKVTTWDPSASGQGTHLTYIDLGAVDQSAKSISHAQWIRADDAPSRARQLVRQGDVLVATVRPNLNGVALVSGDFDGATASTGFAVLRPKQGLDSGYLFHWVRSPRFISEMTRRATGQSYPAVSDRIIRESLIPISSIQEQQRAVRLLDQVDALRAKRREAVALLDDLAQSIFLDMFGDVTSNRQGWPVGAVSDLVREFQGGKSFAPGDEGDKASEYRILKVSAVTTGEFLSQQSKPVPRGYVPADSHFVREGDLLFSRANTEALIGAVALVGEASDNLILPDKIWRFVWHEGNVANKYYVRQLFRQGKFRREIGRRASGTSGSMKNISQEKVLAIPCALVPVGLQDRFGERVQAIEELKAEHIRHLSALDALFASVQYRAFRGELWADARRLDGSSEGTPREQLRLSPCRVARPLQRDDAGGAACGG